MRIKTLDIDKDILIIWDAETGDILAFHIMDFSGKAYLVPEGINLTTMKKTTVSYNSESETE